MLQMAQCYHHVQNNTTSTTEHKHKQVYEITVLCRSLVPTAFLSYKESL